MPVSRHRNEIAFLPGGAGRDFPGGVAASQDRFRIVTFAHKSIGDALDVLAVALHLFRLTQIELVDVTRGPAIGDMDQYDGRLVARSRELADVREDDLIVGRILDGHEDTLVHHFPNPLKNWNSSQMLSAAMINATTYASTLSQSGLVNSPILARSLVNRTSGKTANANCMLTTTWLSTTSFAVPPSPK